MATQVSAESEGPPAHGSQLDHRPVERFLAAFFQERNIRWMLVAGAITVFGSSLMLITKSWSDFSPAVQFLIILGYTGAIHAGGEFCRKRLGLRSTSVVLDTLAVALLPICFASLAWLSPGTGVQSMGAIVPKLVLAVPAIALTWRVSTRTFDRWFGERQPTFLMAYQILAVASALPAVSSILSPATATLHAMVWVLVGWLIMTAGVIKANRHAFWMAESDRRPKVMSLLPIGLLGTQFIVLVATKTWGVLPVNWLGFACVMFAITLLANARSVAAVLRQRTGDLLRPYPLAIVLPLFIGVALAIVGLCFSAVGFDFVSPASFALIPTALLASVAFGWAAKDTRHPLMVWLTLLTVAVFYQSCPVLFGNLVSSIKTATAEAIRQPRVPLSMYGMTYVPLLATLAFVAFKLRREGQYRLAVPVQRFVTIVAVVLFALALTNLTSMFLVGMTNVLLFTWFMITFGDRRYVLGSLVGLTATVAAAIPFGNQVQWWQIEPAWISTVLGSLALILTLSKPIDRWLSSIPNATANRDWCQLYGIGLAGSVGGYWILSAISTMPAPLPLAGWGPLILGIIALAVHAYWHPTYQAGAAFWVLVSAGVIRAGLSSSLPMDVVAVWIGAAAAVVTALTTRLNHVVAGRRAVLSFSKPLHDFSMVLAVASVATIFVPAWVGIHFLPWQSPLGFGWASIVMLTWSLWSAFDSRDPLLIRVVAAVFPLCISGMMICAGIPLSWHGVFLTWVAISFVTLGLIDRMARLSVARPIADHWLAVASAIPFIAVVTAAPTANGALLLTVGSGFYFARAYRDGGGIWWLPAIAIANLGIFTLWMFLHWFTAELFLVPIGLSILALSTVYRTRLPRQAHRPTQCIAIACILGSPIFQVLGGSWWHMAALLVLSLFAVLAAVGLRSRLLLVAGTATLVFDLAAMVIRTSIDNTTTLWVVGVGTGAAVIAVAAVCENHREKILQRIRLLSAELATWH